MKGFAGVTDNDWFASLSQQPARDWWGEFMAAAFMRNSITANTITRSMARGYMFPQTSDFSPAQNPSPGTMKTFFGGNCLYLRRKPNEPVDGERR